MKYSRLALFGILLFLVNAPMFGFGVGVKFPNEFESQRLVLSDGKTISYPAHRRGNSNPVLARASSPINFKGKPIGRSHIIWYFEVKIVAVPTNRWNIAIGICDDQFPVSGFHIGKRDNSFAIESNGQETYVAKEGTYTYIEGKYKKGTQNKGFKEGDRIGCGIKTVDGVKGIYRKLFFTRNGQGFDYASEITFDFTMRGTMFFYIKRSDLFPAVSLSGKGVIIEANFGEDDFALKF